jgi:hypothetical protein
MGRAYATENTHERQRLRTLVARVSDADLTRPLPNGWTVAITLAHLAFWDRQRLALLRRWEREGVTPAPADADTINEGVRVLATALPPRGGPAGPRRGGGGRSGPGAAVSGDGDAD